MSFWGILWLFTLFVALICFYPLWSSRSQNTSTNRDELNKALYFSRLQEIEQDSKQGLLENQQAKQELQQTLLEDVSAQTERVKNQTTPYHKIWFFSGLLSLIVFSGAIYSLVGSWQAEVMLNNLHMQLPEFYQRIEQEDINPLTEQEINQFATALRVDLQKNPTDDKKWWLLGQLGMNLDNPQLALDSYQKAHQLDPDNIDYKLAYARILMFSDDNIDKLQGNELLKQIIRQDHTNLDALSLLAFRYFETEDYKMAAVIWAMMLRLMPEDDPKVPLIEKSIRAARDALEK